MRAGLFFAASALLAGSVAAAIAQRPDAFSASREHPAIRYNTAPTSTAIDELNRKLEDGSVRFTFDASSGYLRPTLEALEVPVESQALVYTATSLQFPRINMQNPRAVYFNDTVSIAYIRGAPLLEVWVVDPRQGPIFYTLDQKASPAAPRFRRELSCLSCHLSWDTLAVPGPFVLTTFPRKTERDYANGFVVDDRVSIAERWGGWYVTGLKVPPRHMGNLPLFVRGPEAVRPSTPPASAKAPADKQDLETSPSSLDGIFDLHGYLTPYSDVVALMVLDHQMHATNLITRAGWEARVGNQVKMREAVNDLVDYLLFVEEAPIPGPIEGSSGFAEKFAAMGPRDPKGRSLRELQLEGRLMKYPLSYLVYSPAFNALPPEAKDLAVSRLRQVLTGEDRSPKYAHLTPDLRQAIGEILRETAGWNF
jgi:hypothetical protein